jgi:aryl-alcohol dehydrogenase-like predicted oxidoreductase
MKRVLGKSNIEVSAMGFGCWAIGGPFYRDGKPSGWGDVDDDESIRAIHAAIDHGITFFDTADVYGAGHSERVLGRALKGYRDKVIIATKFGNTFDEQEKTMTGTDVSPDYIRSAVDASLKRLDTDVIDLYQLHSWISIEEAEPVFDTLDELVDQGKIRGYAWSIDLVDHVRAYAARPNCIAVQQELNVLLDAPEMLAVCDAFDLASINRTCLAMGLLSGKFNAQSRLPMDDVRGDEPEWMKYFKDGKPALEWLKKVDAIKDILTSNGRTPVQGALAWLWARSDRNIPIPGIRTVKQAEENAAAMSFGPLTAAQMQEIDTILGR